MKIIMLTMNLLVILNSQSREFRVENYVKIQIYPEHQLKNYFKKLPARAIRPFCIMCTLGHKTYFLDLPHDMKISLIFNVEDFSLIKVPWHVLLSPHVFLQVVVFQF